MHLCASIAGQQALNDLLAKAREIFPGDAWPEVWLVGGGVRDALSGTSAKDLDFVTTLPPAGLERLGFRLVESKTTLPIYFRSLAGAAAAEVVRIEDKALLLADLQRRDFTINAMALSLTGELLDPCHGQVDLAAKRLQVCSPAVFVDDPLRVVRAFRFVAEGWQLSPTTTALLSETPPAQLAMVPVERFSREMLKALAAPDPGGFFAPLAAGRAAGIFLPELAAMGQVPAGPPEKHPEGDLLTHALQVLARVARQTPDPLARFCALFHDLGKLATPATLYPSHHGHEETGSLLAGPLCDRLRLPTRYRTSLAWICRLHGKANRWGELRLATRLKLGVQAQKAGIELILPLIAASDKDPGTVLTDWETILKVAGQSSVALGITAEQLSRLAGPQKNCYITERRLARLREQLVAHQGFD